VRLLLLGAVLLLAGCSPAGLAAAAIFVDADREAARQADGLPGRREPAMAADRKISEQDCTQPVDYSLGNIRCK
jgi:hypothetical protein